jgi:uncharacterized protein (TIGR03546 family)
MLFRKLGIILRGKATPFQVFAACFFGCVLGFMPGWKEAPGLILAVTLLLIILNANLYLGAIVAGGAKLLSLALTPVLFSLGRWVIDGPGRGLWEWMINAPVLALFGFEYYVTTGSLVAGILVGTISGVLVVKTITGYRRKMVSLEQGSERFREFTGKRWVKILTWLVAGGGPGKNVSYEQLLTVKVGNPIRMLGVVFALLVALLLFLVQAFARGPIVAASLQSGLEWVNGATVDLESADLNLKEGRLTIKRLAMADPNRLETDLLRADSLEADISAASLLRKRLQLDRVVVHNATHGETRRAPGHLIHRPPREKPEAPPAGTRTLDDYLRDAQIWKDRLTQARRWLEKIAGPEAEPAPGSPEAIARAEDLKQRLERQARELGYRRVRADHLIQKSPTLTVTALEVDSMRVPQLEGETLRIVGQHLSTHPGLLGQAPHLEVTSSKDSIRFGTLLGRYAAVPSDNTIELKVHGLQTDRVAGQLKWAGENPVSGGTIDLDARGTWTSVGGVQINLPLQATLNGATFALPGMKPTRVERFELPIGLEGPLDSPRVRVDDQGLANALVKAGIQRATDELTTRAQDEIGRQLGDKAGDQGGQLLRGILGGQKKPAQPTNSTP